MTRRYIISYRRTSALKFVSGDLLMFAKYSVGAQRAAPALARHLLCPKTTLYSAGINKS